MRICIPSFSDNTGAEAGLLPSFDDALPSVLSLLSSWR